MNRVHNLYILSNSGQYSITLALSNTLPTKTTGLLQANLIAPIEVSLVERNSVFAY